jgi:hypothetical protein
MCGGLTATKAHAEAALAVELNQPPQNVISSETRGVLGRVAELAPQLACVRERD